MRSPSASSKLRRRTLTAPAILQSAADRGFNLVGLRRGLKAVLRAERGLDPRAKVDLLDLTVLAFAVGCAPRLVYDEWITPLLRRMDAEKPLLSGTVTHVDDHEAVQIMTHGRSVVAVHLPGLKKLRKTSERTERPMTRPD